MCGQPIDHPIGAFRGLDEAALFEVGEVFRDLDLRLFQERLEMADAEFIGVQEQMEDAQRGLIAQALVDGDETRGEERGGDRRAAEGISPARDHAMYSRASIFSIGNTIGFHVQRRAEIHLELGSRTILEPET